MPKHRCRITVYSRKLSQAPLLKLSLIAYFSNAILYIRSVTPSKIGCSTISAKQQPLRGISCIIPSASSYALPIPKPSPVHTGHALRLNNNTENITPNERPSPPLITALDSARSHCFQSLVNVCPKVSCALCQPAPVGAVSKSAILEGETWDRGCRILWYFHAIPFHLVVLRLRVWLFSER